MKIQLSKKVQKQLSVPKKKIKTVMTLKELNKIWKAQEKWEKKHPILMSFKTFYYFFSYRLWQIFNKYKYDIKWGCQRMFRSYDDPMVFNYWNAMARLNVKLLKHLKRTKSGYPIILLNKKEEKEWKLYWDTDKKQPYINCKKNWEEIMNRMILGWESILKEDMVHIKTKGKYDRVKSEIEKKRLLKLFEKGMISYIKWYRCLWD